MTQQGNLLSCPMFKIEDRKIMVTRVLDALLADPDCRYNLGRGTWRQMTADETANWEARELLVQIKRTFPVSTDVPPPAEVEPLDGEPVDDTTEA